MNAATHKAIVAAAVLDAARWRVDQPITNHDGERVWLGPCFDKDGKRIGITDCCLVDSPCAHHAALAGVKE